MPAVAYAWDGGAPLADAPSPNVHCQLAMLPSGSTEVAPEKATAVRLCVNTSGPACAIGATPPTSVVVVVPMVVVVAMVVVVVVLLVVVVVVLVPLGHPMRN